MSKNDSNGKSNDEVRVLLKHLIWLKWFINSLI